MMLGVVAIERRLGPRLPDQVSDTVTISDPIDPTDPDPITEETL
jgi:hypothetical protein